MNITPELHRPKRKAKQTAPNRNQTVRPASAALGWLSSHTHTHTIYSSRILFGFEFGLVLWKPL